MVSSQESYIEEKSKRSSCFLKRRQGIVKKCTQIAILTNCEVGLFIIGEDLMKEAEEYHKICSEKGHDYYMRYCHPRCSKEPASKKLLEFCSSNRYNQLEKYKKCIEYISRVNSMCYELVHKENDRNTTEKSYESLPSVTERTVQDNNNFIGRTEPSKDKLAENH